MSKEHRRIFRNCTRPRACTVLAKYLRHVALNAASPDDAFVSRATLEQIVANTRWATTLYKTMGYVDDIRTYHGGVLSFKKTGRFITDVRLDNAWAFDENGFRRPYAEIAAYFAEQNNQGDTLLLEHDVPTTEDDLQFPDEGEPSGTGVDVVDTETEGVDQTVSEEPEPVVTEEEPDFVVPPVIVEEVAAPTNSFVERMKAAKAAKAAQKAAALAA